jgi:hypothetical protein
VAGYCENCGPEGGGVRRSERMMACDVNGGLFENSMTGSYRHDELPRPRRSRGNVFCVIAASTRTTCYPSRVKRPKPPRNARLGTIDPAAKRSFR